MALKHKIDKLDGLSDDVKKLYRQDGSAFVLDVELPEDPKIAEFRSNNVTLSNALSALKDQMKVFEGVDPEAIKSMRAQAEAAKADEEKELIKKGRWDELVQRRIAAAAQEFNSKIKASQEEMGKKDDAIKNLTGRLSVLMVDGEITKAIDAAGLKPRPGALDDIYRRARDVWRVDEKGNLNAFDSKSNGPMYSAEKTGELINMKEYVAKRLATEASHLFEGSGGGGASGGAGRGGGGGAVVIGNDPLEFGRNLKGIKDGTVRVRLDEPT